MCGVFSTKEFSKSKTMTSNTTVIRRQNLLLLLQEFAEQHVNTEGATKGSEQAFAAHLQISPSRLSQIKSSIAIGNKLAHQIEVICKRPTGWLSENQPDTKPSTAEIAFLSMAREIWQGQNAKGKRTLAKLVKDFRIHSD
jgi:hypothetical protein